MEAAAQVGEVERWERGKTENHTAFSKTGTRKTCTVIVGILKEKNTKAGATKVAPECSHYSIFTAKHQIWKCLTLQHVIAFIEPYL